MWYVVYENEKKTYDVIIYALYLLNSGIYSKVL